MLENGAESFTCHFEYWYNYLFLWEEGRVWGFIGEKELMLIQLRNVEKGRAEARSLTPSRFTVTSSVAYEISLKICHSVII